MEIAISLHLDDREATQAILEDLRAEREASEFTIESAEEEDAIGMTTADVIVSFVISFSSSVAAAVASERAKAILANLRERHAAVTGGEVHSGEPADQGQDQD